MLLQDGFSDVHKHLQSISHDNKMVNYNDENFDFLIQGYNKLLPHTLNLWVNNFCLRLQSGQKCENEETCILSVEFLKGAYKIAICLPQN